MHLTVKISTHAASEVDEHRKIVPRCCDTSVRDDYLFSPPPNLYGLWSQEYRQNIWENRLFITRQKSLPINRQPIFRKTQKSWKNANANADADAGE